MTHTSSEAHRLVLEFHQATGSAIDDRSFLVRQFRASLLYEEMREAVYALRYQDIKDVAKELADTVVVAYGAAIALGIDLDGAVAAVHQSNMTKVLDGQREMREDGKVLKGPNYQPPDMAPYIKDLG